jgi:hypothetical protein
MASESEDLQHRGNQNGALCAALAPLVERHIGTIRRENLDHVFFWKAEDLERKFADFQVYFNTYRAHASLGSNTSADVSGEYVRKLAPFDRFRW